VGVEVKSDRASHQAKPEHILTSLDQDYTIRARVSEGLSLAAAAKLNVAEIATSGANDSTTYPKGYATGYNAPAPSTNVSSVAVDSVSGVITISYQPRVAASGANTLTLTPFTMAKAAGATAASPAALPAANASFSPIQDALQWRCKAKGASAGYGTAGTLESRFAPAECR